MYPHPSGAALMEESDGLDLTGRAQRVTDVGYSVDDQIHDAVLGMTDEEQFRFLQSFTTEAEEKLVLAQARSHRIGEANSRLEYAASEQLDGLRLESSMPLEVFHWWFAKGETDLGGNPWTDETFMKEFLRDNPQCAVKETSKNIIVSNAWDFSNRKEAA
jgi:hypothetical protein